MEMNFLLRRLTKGDCNSFCVLSASMFIISMDYLENFAHVGFLAKILDFQDFLEKQVFFEVLTGNGRYYVKKIFNYSSNLIILLMFLFIISNFSESMMILAHANQDV